MQDKILYEDNHLIIVNKSPGDIVQGDKTGDEPLSEKLKSYLKEKYNKPGNVFVGVAHRLDRPTSGIVIFAKTGKALARLNDMFKNSEIEKTYWAVVDNVPPKKQDTISHFLLRNQKQNKSYAHQKQVKDSKEARLTYNHIGSSDNFHLIEIELHTGRHHQIRAQLAAIGCLIKGDLKYGFKRSNKNGSIHLHARGVSFIHPVKKEKIELIATPPDDPVWNYFVSLVSDK